MKIVEIFKRLYKDNQSNKIIKELAIKEFIQFIKDFSLKIKIEKLDFDKNICIDMNKNKIINDKDQDETLNYIIDNNIITVFINGEESTGGYTAYEFKVTKCKIVE